MRGFLTLFGLTFLATILVACDDGSAPGPGPDNTHNPPGEVTPPDQKPPEQLSTEELRTACQEALAQKSDDPDPALMTRCDQEFPAMVREARCREHVQSEYARDGWDSLEDSGVSSCIDEFPGLYDEIFPEDSPCDQNGPLAENCECVDYLDHPDWEWLNSAVGLQYECVTDFGRGECWLEIGDRNEYCGISCGGIGDRLQAIEHLENLDFQYTNPFDEVTSRCAPM